MIIITGCERSGTDIVSRQLADYYGAQYLEETWAEGHSNIVMKHSLNLSRNLKHLEFLEHKYPDAEFRFLVRDPREVCRSIMQKIWGRYPHTYSLDDAIIQYREVFNSCWDWANNTADEIIKYERLPELHHHVFDYKPIMKWKTYFTMDQIEYIHESLHGIIKHLEY